MTVNLRLEKIYVALLAAVQFCHILDFVIMMPLGPQFMRVFHISPSEFSLLVSSYTFSAGIVGFFGALYADNFDRKKMLLFIFSGFILGTLLCALAQNFYFLLIARIIAGAFGGVANAIVFSMIADLIPSERRGTATGVVMSAFSLSSVLGVPIGLYLANQFDWHAPFYFIVVLSSITFLISWRIFPSIPKSRDLAPIKETLRYLVQIGLKKDYMQLFSLTTFLVFGVFMIVPFISPYMVKNVGLLETDLPLIYLVGGCFTIISARTIGKLCDHFGTARIFTTMIILSFIPIIAITHLPPVSKYIAIACTTMFMMFVSGRFIPAMTMISLVVEPKERGTFMSLENAMRQLFSGFSSLLAGVIIYENTQGKMEQYHLVGYLSLLSGIGALIVSRFVIKKYQLK